MFIYEIIFLYLFLVFWFIPVANLINWLNDWLIGFCLINCCGYDYICFPRPGGGGGLTEWIYSMNKTYYEQKELMV